MSQFLHQASYTAEAWKTLISNPMDRTEVIRPVVEKLGGKIINVWFAFGEHDIILITEFPANVNAAAMAIAFASGGVLKSMRTTPLLTQHEALEAMKNAGSSGYKPLATGAAARA
jgi:uncharacterized protein with GYD domain